METAYFRGTYHLHLQDRTPSDQLGIGGFLLGLFFSPKDGDMFL
jgi:hypothetical protein